METIEQLENGPEVDDPVKEMVESPMMQYLMLNVCNAWAVD